jgi:hypothetical protein
VKPSFVALVWLGIVIGVSFMATPIKFTASTLDLPTALEVGRVTFRLLERVEWMLALALIANAWLARQRPPWSFYLVVIVLAAEAFWLLPVLGVRTDAIRAGARPPASNLHVVFIAAELVKCVALGHIAVAMSRQSYRPVG